MELNGINIAFSIDENLLVKSKYSKEGVKNVMKSMSEDFIKDQRQNFLVSVEGDNDNVFHFATYKSGGKIIAALIDVHNAAFYRNTGLVTRKLNMETV